MGVSECWNCSGLSLSLSLFLILFWCVCQGGCGEDSIGGNVIAQSRLSNFRHLSVNLALCVVDTVSLNFAEFHASSFALYPVVPMWRARFDLWSLSCDTWGHSSWLPLAFSGSKQSSYRAGNLESNVGSLTT